MRRRRFLKISGTSAVFASSGCLGYEIVESSSIEDRRDRIRELEDSIDSANERIEELEEELSQLQAQNDEQLDTIDELESEIETKEETIGQLEQERADLRSELNEIVDEPDPPHITVVNLVSDWEEFGDALANPIDSIERGETAMVAFRVNWPVHDGQLRGFTQTTIYGMGSSVAQQSNRLDILQDRDSVQYEHYRSFGTEDWEEGEYEAEVIVRDEITGAQSSPQRGNFSVD